MLTKKELIKLVHSKPKVFSKIIKGNHKELFQKINSEYDGKTFSEKLYQYVYGRDSGTCLFPGCNNKTFYDDFNKGYRNFCSVRCSANSESTKKKYMYTCIRKYNVEYSWKAEDVKKKIRETKKRIYGNEKYVNVEKRNLTNLEKYGNKCSLYGKDVRKKVELSKIKKYGNINYNNPEKSKKTREKRYGGYGNNRIQAEETCLKKYGVGNVSQLTTVIEKANITKFKKFYKTTLQNRLNGNVLPLFSLKDYNGVQYYKLYSFRCSNCKTEFKDYLNNAHIPRCPVCYPKKISVSQKELYNFLRDNYSGKIIENDRSILNGKELDLYLPDKNLAVEFDGLYWHSELNGKDKYYHLHKTKLCEQKDIHLIHIFEDEWLNRQEVVKNKLKHILGTVDKQMCARQCKIKEVGISEKNLFLEKYHIQGSDASKIKFGLFYENLLVGVMTFKNQTENCELIRFATSMSITDGVLKLLKHFIRNYRPKKIISYADRRWVFFRNNLYEKMGFKVVEETEPNYWYIIGGKHRSKQQGYDRIWDCGTLKYELNVQTT